MKIEAVEVYHYGKLHQLHLQFDELQLIYGNNEAGKTTLINFILDILFGFEHRSQTHPYAPKDNSKMGGKLTVSTGTDQLVIERVEGKNGGELSLFDAVGNPLPPTRLQQLLGPINRDVYYKLFYFGAPSLSEIAKLTSEELEDRIRRVGVVGINQWLNLEKEIKTQAGDLYKPTGKNPELNQKLKEYDRLQTKVADAQQQYPEYVKLTQELGELQTQIQQLQQQEQTTQQQLQELYRDKQSWSDYQQFQQLQQLDLTAKAGFTSADLDQLQSIETKVNYLNKDVKAAQEQLKADQHQSVPADYQFYLQHQHQIDELGEQLPNYQEQWRQVQSLQTQLATETGRLRDDEAETGGANAQPFSASDQARVQELMQQRATLQTQQQTESAQSTRTTPVTSNKVPYGLMGMGVLLLGLGLLSAGLVQIVLAVLGIGLLVAGGYQKYQQTKEQQPESQRPATEQLHDQLHQIDQELTQLGDQYHITAVPQQQWLTTLQTGLKQREQQRARVQALQTQVDQLQQQVTAYVQAWAFCPFVDQVVNQTPGEALQTLQKWLATLKDERQQQAQVSQRLQDDERQLDSRTTELHEAQHQLQAAFKQRQVSNMDQFHDELEAERKREQARSQREQLQQKLTPELKEHLQAFGSEAELQAQETHLTTKDQELKQQLSGLVESRTKKQTQLQQVSQDGTLAELRQEQANLETEINDLTGQWLVLQLSYQWIERVLNEASHGRFPKVQKLAQQYFAILTDQHYRQIRYQKKLEVVTNDGQRFNLGELSRGTMQQLYLALILALTVSFSDEFPLPIIIDDGFTEFDKTRTEHALALLQELAATTQIIYLTADDRIASELTTAKLLKLE
ncbi:AAA family ATPase [Fructilactobacillus myrtifloralis]|uniref:AAA family ATPase n=1 Tax=Fructilactobacillus myrtifloralis TaxID=2940301 RepID=A0ABY5BRL7_9LACO|nr:AAA family ATPase [Fructilactobacillus myrtifloralis]USS85226.1 AAA family ATPase [Fructilactobacillus myrtifloralis]